MVEQSIRPKRLINAEHHRSLVGVRHPSLQHNFNIMNYNNRKRKGQPHYARRFDFNPYRNRSTEVEFQFLSHHEPYQAGDEHTPDPLKALYAEAHEADIIHGSNAEVAARSLEVAEYRVEDGTVTSVPMTGSALIRLRVDHSSHLRAEDDNDRIPAPGPSLWTAFPEAWVDRYDARLLLDANALPQSNTMEQPHLGPSSPGGWSDLPSDTEDMFFFTAEDIEDIHREKRRRFIEQAREERLKARLQEDGLEEGSTDDLWGGSDEEPEGTQIELMRRTAMHILSSPNPAQLEMRILTNHGSDPRFSFLRGRWKHAWDLAKAKARIEKAKSANDSNARPSENVAQKAAGLGVVADYGSDSDSNEASGMAGEGDGEDKAKMSGPPKNADEQSPVDGPHAEDVATEAAKEAKRRKLKEWLEKRQLRKSGDE